MAVSEITVEQLAELLTESVTLVDVREDHEWIEGRVPGATHIPLGHVLERADEIPADEQVYIVCRSGARSMQACVALSEMGYDCVNIAGGTQGWIASGRSVDV